MKKIKFIVLTCLVIGVIYLYLQSKLFSPLKEKEFNELFSNYDGSARKICYLDFLGFNCKGELSEAYLYDLGNLELNSDFPANTKTWEYKEITDEVITSKWKNCPLDSESQKLYMITLLSAKFDEKECMSSFESEINNVKNYYSYISISESEQYFLLYCPQIHHLYYLRQRGM